MVTNVKGRGEAAKWVIEHVDYDGDDCLIWPFSTIDGYAGGVSHSGKIVRAHRLMCFLAHGAPPSWDCEAAHTCGRGKFGCIHPKHLEWKTASENQKDRALHGTNSGGKRGKMTPARAAAMRAIAANHTQAELAQMFGISRSRVSGILLDSRACNSEARGYIMSGKYYRARIRHNYQEIVLGTFDTADEASAAYNTALVRIRAGLHPIENESEAA